MPNVLITGANRGLGLALARRFAARPDTRVFATARDLGDAADLEALAAAHPAAVEIVAADVADPVSIDALAATIKRVGAKLDLLINNAAMATWKGFGEVDAATFETIFRVNALGPVLVTQALRKSLAPRARIVNVTSMLGSVGLADGTGGLAYPMSKAALNMFSKQLAVVLEPEGIAVLALHPGWVQTRMGGQGARLGIAESADGMMAVIDAFDLSRTGAFLTYAGEELEW